MNSIEKILAPEFGPMTSRKVVSTDPGIVPDWRVKAVIGSFLKKQTDTEKWKTGKVRQRDIEQERYRRIVDGRTG